MTPILRKKLSQLGPALIAEHGKDIQHAPDANPAKSFPAPKPFVASHPVSTNSNSTSTSTSGGKVNVTTVSSTEEFRTSAAELYTTFTDPQRIAAFTRGSLKLFEGAKIGGKFEMFDGNVSGEYTELKEPTNITQKWRLKQWPQGHYSSLNIQFDQNNVDAVTVMRVEWKGVPVGQEEVTRRNWDQYYVRSIKTIFGFGTIL